MAHLSRLLAVSLLAGCASSPAQRSPDPLAPVPMKAGATYAVTVDNRSTCAVVVQRVHPMQGHTASHMTPRVATIAPGTRETHTVQGQAGWSLHVAAASPAEGQACAAPPGSFDVQVSEQAAPADAGS